MSKVIVSITAGSVTANRKTDRVGLWTASLQLVDGNNQPDPRPAARKELSGEIAGATHNQAALEAVRQALAAMKRDGVTVTVLTSSDYLIGVLARHWKPARNQEQIAAVKTLLQRHDVTFEKLT